MSHRGTPFRAVALLTLVLAAALCVPAAAGAITRAEVLARAERWIARAVPYSQSRFATVAGSLIPTSTVSPQKRGYRTDCSGFVSMALGLTTTSGKPLSLSTATLDNVMIRVAKADLQPGDVILRPNDLVIAGKRVSYGHAVVFAGWTDESQTRYLAYHESSSRRGSVAAEIPWGVSGFYNEKGFSPYRCTLVSERTKIAPAAGQ